jgi:hypothetical protein
MAQLMTLSENEVGVGHKPGSVEGHHSSRRHVTMPLKRPTRGQRGPRLSPSIWSCSRRGLPCHRMLPPMRCALTAPFHPYRQIIERAMICLGGLLSAALSVGSRPPGITWRLVLWSPDFPPPGTHRDEYRAAMTWPTPVADSITVSGVEVHDRRLVYG